MTAGSPWLRRFGTRSSSSRSLSCVRTWAKAGRDPDTLDITVLQPPGPADDLRRALDRADQLDVRRVLLTIDEERMADAEALLDQAGAVIPGR